MSDVKEDTEKTKTLNGAPARDRPFYVEGTVEQEPQKYLGTRPYELDKYEFSVLKKKFFGKDALLSGVIGATAASFLLVLSKTVISLSRKKTPEVESYELVSILIGLIIIYILYKKCSPGKAEAEKINLERQIDEWFVKNPKRDIHVTVPKG
ncbi:hypothetical protein ACJJIU_00300 [Microbulbifer sp. CnH-101-E]|uniref:hypothetical protein n=1 Tax=unclassified Microbulbifer TaxID=2619833 RepID=UPI004039D807